MALTDLFVRTAKAENPKGTKFSDGDGMYLLVSQSGKYWRLNYRFKGKRRTLALRTYPTVSLAKARQRCADARTLLADGIDPGEVKRKQKAGDAAEVNETFEAIAKSWLAKTKAARAASTQEKITNWLERNIFPYIGKSAISKLGPRDVLKCVQRMESRGAIDSAHRVKQVCGQVFRFAVANTFIDRDVTADLKGALAVPVRSNYAAITEPKSGHGVSADNQTRALPCARIRARGQCRQPDTCSAVRSRMHGGLVPLCWRPIQ